MGTLAEGVLHIASASSLDARPTIQPPQGHGADRRDFRGGHWPLRRRRPDRRGRASESLGQRKSRSSSWPNDREVRPCGQIVPALACPQGGSAMSQPISVVVPVYEGVT